MLRRQLMRIGKADYKMFFCTFN